MQTAYTDAAGRTTPDFTELGAGQIGGLTLVPGLYKWGTDVLISSDVTLSGGPNDVWIFQIAGKITQANGTMIHLSGGALAANIFWQSFGDVSLGTTAHFEGVIIAQTAISLATGASINGRLLAQTAVTPVSYTHLDVYKRQDYRSEAGARRFFENWKQALKWQRLEACLLYTSRCV